MVFLKKTDYKFSTGIFVTMLPEPKIGVLKMSCFVLWLFVCEHRCSWVYTFYLIRLSYLLLSRHIRLTLQFYKGRTLTKLIKCTVSWLADTIKLLGPSVLRQSNQLFYGYCHQLCGTYTTRHIWWCSSYLVISVYPPLFGSNNAIWRTGQTRLSHFEISSVNCGLYRATWGAPICHGTDYTYFWHYYSLQWTESWNSDNPPFRV